MITTGAVDEDLIEQFKTDMEAFDCVTRVTRKHGRSVSVQVEKNEDGVPSPHKELGEIKDGNIVTDDYAISTLAGSGHAPGEKYTHCLAVSPLCSECGEKPQKGLDDDDHRCSDCAFGDNLLSAEPGTTAIVEAGDDVYGIRHEEGEQFEATADEDGFLRDDDGVMNDGRYSIVEIVDSPTDDDEDDDDEDLEPCPICGSTDRRLTSGELGYGTEVYCDGDGCGFRLANVDPRDSLYQNDTDDQQVMTDGGTPLTKIEISKLTDREMEHILPERDYITIGYESNRTVADTLEQTIQNPTRESYHQHHVRGTITGTDPDDEDRGIGFSKGRLNSTGSTLGTPVYVKVPNYDPIDKIDYTVRFRIEDGNFTPQSTDDGVIEGVTETYDYDYLPYDLDLSNAEAFEWEKKKDWYVKRARFDVLVPITLPAALDDDEVIDAALDQLPRDLEWKENIPEIGHHIEEPDPMNGRKRNLRMQTVIDDVTIEKPEIMTDGGTEIQKAEVDTDYPLPVEEQTPLPELVKIRWDQRQESHCRILHSLQASYDDANENEPLIGVAYRCLQRQKTQTVVRTREEAESLHYELQQYLQEYGIPAPQGTEPTFRRVLDALESKLEEQGFQINTDQNRPKLTRPE